MPRKCRECDGWCWRWALKGNEKFARQGKAKKWRRAGRRRELSQCGVENQPVGPGVCVGGA